MKYYIYTLLSLFLLLGCQSANSTFSSKPKFDEEAIQKAKSYIGQDYTVMLDGVFLVIRPKLYDGQKITVIDSQLNPKYGFVQILIADDLGNQVFDKYYSFSDLGLLNEEITPIYTGVDPNKVKEGMLGKILHGYGDKTCYKNYTYISMVTKSKIDGLVAYGYANGLSGLGVQCLNGKVAITYTQTEIIAAPNSTISYSIYTEGKDVRSGQGFMLKGSYKSLAFFPSSGVVEDLLIGKRGGIKISTMSTNLTRKFVLDGFAEMYTRVKNNCSKD